MAVTIYHNPRCSKSRQTLALITDSGVAHTIVKYLDESPDAATLLGLSKKLGVPLTDIMRSSEAAFKDANDLPALNDNEKLADWLATHPAVLQRPIVVHDETGDAVVGRPPENVLALLQR